MRWLQQGGWLSHWMARARDLLFSHHRRHRPVHYGGREFTAPRAWKEASLPRAPGLYAIQVKHWWKGMTPIHFGESENLHEELMVEGAEGFVHWLMHRGAARGLFVSFHASEEVAHRDVRSSERARLLRKYFPRRAHSMEEHLHRIHRAAPRRPRMYGRDSEESDSIR